MMARLVLAAWIALLAACGPSAPVTAPDTARTPPRVKLPEIGDDTVELGGPAAMFPNPVVAAALSNDGKRLAVVDDKGTVRVRDATGSGAGVEVGSIELPREQDPIGLTMSPDASLVAVADNKDGMVIVDATGKKRVRAVATKDPDVAPVFVSAARVAVGDRSSIRVVDVVTGADVETYTMTGDRAVVRAIAHAPGTGALAACSFEKVVVFRPGGGTAFERAVKYPTAVAISEDGGTLAYAAGSSSRSLVVVDVASGTTLSEIATRHDVERIWLRDGAVYFVERKYDSPPALERYDLGPKKQYTPAARVEGTAVAFAASGAAAIVARGTEVYAVDPKSFERTAAATRHGEAVPWLEVTGDDRWLVSSSSDGKVLRWELASPERPPLVLLDRKEEEAHRIAVSPDGKLAAMDTRQRFIGGVHVVALDSGETKLEIDYPGWVSGLAFEGPDKLWVATNAGDVALWDIGAQERERFAPVTPGDRGSLDSTYWDGYLLTPKAVVFRPRSISLEHVPGESMAFALPAGRPTTRFDGLSLLCRVRSATEIVCPGEVRAKAGGKIENVLRILDLATGRARLLPAPGSVGALAISPDRRLYALSVMASENEPTAAMRSFLVVLDASSGAEKARRPLPEAATAVAMTNAGHVIVANRSGALRMMRP